ncbi:ABC transporter transmembrane region [Necator americanus]|uniref:ABC transporter transmembrane region n=1 Tax=Necator americanus TaxID=51031 RepID=W2TBN6_NECAM|nr:ABC transporter transmembrane region [Necator americanus]ETN79009.1 ABC transporter transmembrane region [Necator americanus]
MGFKIQIVALLTYLYGNCGGVQSTAIVAACIGQSSLYFLSKFLFNVLFFDASTSFLQDLCSEMGKSKGDSYNSKSFLEKFMDVLLCRGDLSEENLEKEPVSVTELFRYASKNDLRRMAAGFALAVLVGIIFPVTCILGGLYANIYLRDTNHFENESLWRQAMYLCAGYLATGCLLFVLCYMQIEDGIGDKMGMLARGVSMFLASAAYAFAFSWRITLICVGVGPVSAITMAVMSKLSASSMQGMMSASGSAGAIVEEAVMNVKTVAACNGQEHMVKKYSENLKKGIRFAIKYSFINGFFEGFMFFQLYVFFAAAFLYGIPSYYYGITPEPGTIFITASAILLGT